MSLPKYPEYKDSGVSWLGEVPAHWDVCRLKSKLSLRTEKAERRIFPVALENIEGWTGRYLETETEFQGEGVSFDSGDILFGKLRPYLAKVLLAQCAGEAVGDFHVLRPSNDIVGRYAQYQMLARNFIDFVNGETFGSKMPRASWDSLGGMPFVSPSPSEQVKIATFLDRETAKIDALIAEQEKLIALLAEKRQATISRAVTRGLDPNVPLKDSGVPWLGKVPMHWEATRLGHLARQIVDGAHFTPTYVDQGVPFLRVTDITASILDLSEVKRIPEHEHVELSRRCRPEKGDLLLSKNGTIGMPRVVNWDWDFSIFVSLCLIKLGEKINANFAAYVFLSSAIKIQISEGAKQSTVTNLHLEKIAGFKFPLPPVFEQLEIVNYLNVEIARIDALKVEAEHAITLLKERRAALISAAVTGKIDVRGLAA